MSQYYLAVDIGASSGRHMLARIQDGKIELEEIYRFENGMKRVEGKLLWDTEYLFNEIINGMKKCKELNKIPVSMSIDTWAVDYVLLDENDHVLGDSYGYRDHRTDGMDEVVNKVIDEKELYAKTGIQKQIFNTIYQLTAVKENTPELFEKAKTFIMLPDYFQFLLTGNKMCEYTNASTTQLVSPETYQWDKELIESLGLPKDIFLPISMPGTLVGSLKEDIKKEVGFDLDVVLCGSHDTASAVMAVPESTGESVYISSGTWSLMGIESKKAIINDEARLANFTNEGGYDHRFRFLKNIMGLWMIQSIRHEYNDAYSFAQLCELAQENKDFPSRVDVNDDKFLSPDNMTQAVQDYCKETGQRVPETIGELAEVVYQSLAICYKKAIHNLEEIAGKTYNSIHIIGGGSNAVYLNQLTASATGKKIYAGPSEASALGNMLAQMIRNEEFTSLQNARICVFDSFDIKKYIPKKRRINKC